MSGCESLSVIPAELAHMPQYVSLFVIGLLAGRGEWFIRIPSAIGSRWFVVGAAAFVAGIGLFFVRDRLPEGINFGVVWGFFEGFVCVGMILGLTVFFRRWLNQAEPLLAYLEGQVYWVYIVHFFGCRRASKRAAQPASCGDVEVYPRDAGRSPDLL